MHRLGVGFDSAPGALAPVRVLLSWSINAYQPHPTHSWAHRDFAGSAAYTRCLRCAGAPRRPPSGSELSLLIPSRHAGLNAPGEHGGHKPSVDGEDELGFSAGCASMARAGAKSEPLFLRLLLYLYPTSANCARETPQKKARTGVEAHFSTLIIHVVMKSRAVVIDKTEVANATRGKPRSLKASKSFRARSLVEPLRSE